MDTHAQDLSLLLRIQLGADDGGHVIATERQQ